MSGDDWRASGFKVASPARIYDYLLGGKDHLPVDREAAERIIAAYPEARALARANRRFVVRAVWYLAEHGIRQFVDLGSGLLASPNVHEVARQVRPDARVVYVDDDPAATVHGEAACAAEGVAVIDGDIRRPQDILCHRRLTGLVDFSAPVAVLCTAVLHFIADEDHPKDIVAAFRWRMSEGSYLAVSHAVADDASKPLLSAIADVYKETRCPAVPRTAEEIEGLFTGLDLVEPGIVDVHRWDSNVRAKNTKIRILAGVGRKPH